MREARTVVLVEDNEDDADLIVYAFEKAGILNPVLTFRDGQAATEYLSHVGALLDRPELILLDLKLPRRSGFDVLASIRSTDATKYVPVVILTSSEHDRDIQKAYALGANSYVTKPPTRDALLAMVKSVDTYWLKINRAVSA